MSRSIVTVLALLGAIAPSLDAQCETAVLVTYYSAAGHTRAMAEAVAAGAGEVAGTTVQLRSVDSTTADQIAAAEAVVVGSPVHFANVAPPVLEFISRWPFLTGEMRDKVGAAFVSGGGISAGEEEAQLGILRAMLIYGMIVVGGPEWTGGFGASAVTDEAPFDSIPGGGLVARRFLDKAEALGRRVATVTHRVYCGLGN